MTQDSTFWALAALAARDTALTGGSMHLAKGDPGIIGPDKTHADYAAVECDFDGYAAIDPLPAMLPAYQDGANRVSQQMATQQFDYVDGVGHVTNNATFVWLEDAAHNVIQTFTLPEGGVDFVGNLSSLPIDLKFTENTIPTGA